MVISQVSEQFLNHCRSAVSLSTHTLRAYESDLNDVRRYFGSNKKISVVGTEDLRSYIRYLRDQRKFKETSIKRRIACMKLLFRWAQRENLIESNPFEALHERIRLPRRLPRALDSIDTAQLRKNVAQTNHSDGFDLLCHKTAILLLLETGIRVGELASINIADVSISDRCIRINGKGNRQRLVYLLSPAVHRVLELYLPKRLMIDPGSERLFVTATGKLLTAPKVRLALRTLSKQASITTHITPHMLRHTCATRWLEAGLDIRYVQKLLGHHSISTTEIYTHVSDQGLREALTRAVGGEKR
ncbi:MAG: integrase [Betaproteobacteria bacterium]|nr:MAG: integrase [Betaproteobacteria bacterium]